MVGIVIVSHSATLAAGVRELAAEMAGPDVRLELAGGIDAPEPALGTDAVRVAEAIARADSGDGVLVLMDLGSAVLSAETALDLLTAEQQGRVLLCEAPLVEGAVAAAVAARLGASLPEVAAEARVDLRGVVDRTQMEQVVYQWRTNGRSAWKVPILGSVLEHADFRGKPSTRYSPETPHDFMHAKVTVADDWIFAGSFNLSRSGERNAENVLELQDPELADRVAAYIDEVRGRYESMPAPGDGRPT